MYDSSMPAQPVDATLYPETERWGLWRCVEDIFEASEGSSIYRCIRKPIWTRWHASSTSSQDLGIRNPSRD